jgi:hypothetical protein
VRDEFLDREDWLDRMERLGLTPENFHQELERILRHQVTHGRRVEVNRYLLEEYFSKEMA